ncbi:MAG TPA: VWA domain-containing protein [Bryobacteraceae bacterium]|jgi:VWFA-related protein
MFRNCVAVSLCGLLLSIPAVPQSAQQAPQGQQPDIRVSVNEVIVPVTVTDDKGRFVSNLEAKDFRVLDEGRPQRISFFSHDQRQPIVVGFLVDLSNNSKIHWKTYQDAIREMVWNLLPGDKRYSGYLVTYGNEAEVAVNTTSDGEKLADKVLKMKPGGGSALFDAIYKACTNRSLIQGEPYEPRRILIVIGDGHDNASKKTLDEVLELAQRNLVTIYGMSTMAFGFGNEDRDVLERLTTETGGHVEYPLNTGLYKDVSGYLSNPSDAGNYALTVGTGGYAAEISRGIITAIGGISGEITTQYVLRYNPDVDPDGKQKVFRKIRVEVPQYPSVKIHARVGYFPKEVPGATPSTIH